MSCSCRSFSFFGRLAAVLVLTLSTVCGIATARAQGVAGPRVVRASASRVVTLEPLTTEERAAQSLLKDPKNSQEVPEGFREFGTARAGEVVETKSLTLRFAAAVTLTKIEGTPDFKVEQGGSCVEGYSYAANQTCTLLVRFTPQGPGRRVGKLKVTNSVEAKPLFVGLGGNGYSPTISFTPSIITTVPQTVSGGQGIVLNAGNLAVDGGDGLYIADTGNAEVRYLGTDGTLQDLADHVEGVSDPQGIAVDTYENLFFSQADPASLYFYSVTGGGGAYYSQSTSCAIGATCDIGSAPLNSPAALASDPSGNVFLSVSSQAYEFLASSFYYTSDYTLLVDNTDYISSTDSLSGPIAVDEDDALYGYSTYMSGDPETTSCLISSMSYYLAVTQFYAQTSPVAGGRGCGFSGDGGQARAALIGMSVGQMVFDIAGNFYFTDTDNQRVRRIDAATGIITTIAGNGAIGYYGDNGPATLAALDYPTGVTVDSQGQVYVLSYSTAGEGNQVVRKVGTEGALNLGQVTVGSSSTAQTVTVANTGNSVLDFLHVGFSSGNTTDFAMDVNSTTCNFTVPLASGRSCKIGFIFTPTATGNRSAVLTITDDTVAGVNTIQLTGAGYTTATLTPSSLSFASTVEGSESASQTLTLTNTGKATLTVSDIAIDGSSAAAKSFLAHATCVTVAVGASCPITVAFEPTAAGALSASLYVYDNVAGGFQTVALTGTGVAAAAKASLSPTSLTFASTAVGATSAAQSIKLSNTGTAALGITSVKMAGTDPNDYPFTQNCGTSVAAGGSCTISVSFKPAATGTRTATITIVASTGTITAAVTGTATAAAVKKPTKVTLNALESATLAQGTVSLSAQVKSSSSALPAGTVQLWEGTHMWAATQLSGGAAVFSLAALPNGEHVLDAVYAGDATDSGSSSPVLTVVVGPPVDRSGPVKPTTPSE